jgi:hypothetical protein
VPLKRELRIQGRPYRLTISRLGLHLARKGRRKGCELSWLDFVNGDAALAKALNASLSLAGHKRSAQARPEPSRHSRQGAQKPARTASASPTRPVNRPRRARASSRA